ncbi:MAG: hypothetical protein AAGB51_04640 [Planctomycetota bacterium]
MRVAPAISVCNLEEGFASLERALGAYRLYGEAHSAFARALVSVATLGPSDSGPELLGVGAEGLVPAGADSPLHAGRLLAAELAATDIAAIEIVAVLDETSARILCALLTAGAPDDVVPSEWAGQLTEASGGIIRFHAIDLTGVGISDGLSDQDASLSILSFVLRGNESPDHVAKLAIERLRSAGEAAVAPMREEIAYAARAARGSQALRNPGSNASSRLRAFFDSLDPRTREALTCVPVERPGEWIPVLSELVDTLPADEVMRSLERVDEATRTPSRSVMLLFARLASVTSDSPDQMARLGDLVKTWASAPGVSGRDEQASLDTLGTLLSSASAEDFNGAEYDRMLSSLAEEQAVRDELGPATQSFAVSSIAKRTSELSIDLALAEPADSDGTSLDRALDRVCDLARDGDVEPAAWLASVSDTGRERLLSRLDSTEQIERIVLAAGRPGTGRIPATKLLHAFGKRGQKVLLRTLSKVAPEEAQALVSLCLGGEREVLAGCLTELAQEEHPPIDGLAGVLQAVPFELLYPRLRHTLINTEAKCRARAVNMLALTHGEWPVDLLSEVIGDRDQAIRAGGLRALRLRRGKERNELLARFVEGRICASATPQEVADAVAALRGVSGAEDRLAIALSRLSGSPRAGLDGRLRQLVELLEPLREHRRVARALRYWRVRPGGVCASIRSLLDRGDAA